MHFKAKSIAAMAMPLLLLLFWVSCDDERTFSDKYIFTKSIEKKFAVIGEPLEVKLSLTNRSMQHVEFYELKKELKQHDFAVIGDNVFKGYELRDYGTQTIIYKILPLSAGKKKIGSSKITKVKILSYDSIYPVAGNTGFSNSVTISVQPIELSISLLFLKTKALQGDKIHFDVLFQNKSIVDIEGIELFFDGNADDVNRFETKVYLKQFSIPAGKSKKIPFVYRAQEVKKADLGRCFIKNFITSGHLIPLDESYKSNPAPQITVIPVDLKVSQHFSKRKVKLGEEFLLELLVENKSNEEIRDLSVLFDGDLGNPAKVRVKKQSKFLSIPCRQARKIVFQCKAMQAGTVLPGKAIIKGIQVGYKWLYLKKGYARSNPGSAIDIAPVRLPGFRNALTYVTKEFEQYFDNFLVMTLSIIFGILMLGFLLRFVISTVVSEFMYGKIIIASLAGSVLGVLSVFFFTGIYWIWLTIIPSFEMCAALWAGSCFGAFVFRIFRFVRGLNFIYGTLISGTCFALFSYVLFTGFKCFDHNGFENFPLGITVFLVFGASLGINAVLFKKIRLFKEASWTKEINSLL